MVNNTEFAVKEIYYKNNNDDYSPYVLTENINSNSNKDIIFNDCDLNLTFKFVFENNIILIRNLSPLCNSKNILQLNLTEEFIDNLSQQNYQSINVDKNGFKINGEYKYLRGGTLQWFRIPESEWEQRIIDFKNMGFNTVDMYVSWNEHELKENVFDFKTKEYLEYLKDILINDNINIPITTCPGQGKIEGMGDAEGIIPMPNVYFNEKTELSAYNLLQDMHSDNYNGAYSNYPSGITETDRTTSKMKSLIFGGLDGFFAFNVVSLLQDGYRNSLTMFFTGLNSFFEFSMENLSNVFVSPNVGYFPNVIDYYGAISSSGSFREKYYNFRKTNMFFNDFEKQLAPLLYPVRSGNHLDNDSITSTNSYIGATEDGNKTFYSFVTNEETIFYSILNENKFDVELSENSLKVDNLSIPQWTKLTIPVENFPGNIELLPSEGIYTMILVKNLKLTQNIKLLYSTSEILTSRTFNGEKLLVLYGKKNKEGELVLEGLNKESVVYKDDSITYIDNQNNNNIAIKYVYDEFLQLKINLNGEILNIIITDSYNAGRFWFFNLENVDYLISGIDYLKLISTIANAIKFQFEYPQNNSNVYLMSSNKVEINNLNLINYNESTKVSKYEKPAFENPPQLNESLISLGKTIKDNNEIQFDYDDSNWIKYEGEPKNLEYSGIIRGHSFYRGEVNLTQNDIYEGELYIDSASDIIGVYINGNYITTLSPLGTEINNKSNNGKYQFTIPENYLKTGKNIIALRTEIWGHGSFMWPRGSLKVGYAKIPALGFDSLKGLSGEAKLNGTNIDKWSVKADLTGESLKYYKKNIDSSLWNNSTIPLQLNKGDIIWYKTNFKTSDIYNKNKYNAPVSLNLSGKNTKATIFVNGMLIGRWISDNTWLERGSWTNVLRDMWSNTNPDYYPVPQSILNEDETLNDLTIAFEDTSSDIDTTGGIINKVQFVYNKDEKENTKLNESSIGTKSIIKQIRESFIIK